MIPARGVIIKYTLGGLDKPRAMWSTQTLGEHMHIAFHLKGVEFFVFRLAPRISSFIFHKIPRAQLGVQRDLFRGTEGSIIIIVIIIIIIIFFFF